MSQNWEQSSSGTNVLYGFDTASGGFFWTEFSDDDKCEEVYDSKDALTLTELVEDLRVKFKIKVDINRMVEDLKTTNFPTQLQVNVGKMFDRDILEDLRRVIADLQNNYSKYFMGEN